MPPLKPVLTLKEMILRLIIRNIDKYDWNNYFSGEGVPLPVARPFDDLPSCIIQELIDRMAQIPGFRITYLHLLLNSRVKRLDLTSWRSEALDITLNIIALSCKKLTHLNLSRSFVNEDALVKLFQSLPLLIDLNLHVTKTTDQVIATIGINCQNTLTRLDLSNCEFVHAEGLVELFKSLPLLISLNVLQTQTTDEVIIAIGNNCPNLRELSFSIDAISDSGMLQLLYNPHTGRPGCKLLRKLNLNNLRDKSHITLQSLLSVIMYCKDLGKDVLCGTEALCNNYLYETMFNSMHMLYNNYDADFTCEIKNVFINSSDVCNERFDFLTKCMPLVENFQIFIHDDALFDYFDTIKEWEHLRVLTVSIFPDELLITGFLEGKLKRFLEIRGNQLTALTIEEINNFNWTFIGIYCENLEHLCITNRQEHRVCVSQLGKYSRHRLLPNRVAFRKLKTFDVIIGNGIASDPCQVMNVLTLANNLKSVDLSGNIIRSRDIIEIISQNYLMKLDKLRLHGNRLISKQAIDSLLNADNSLTELEVYGCEEINSTIDYETRFAVIKARNLHLELSFEMP